MKKTKEHKDKISVAKKQKVVQLTKQNVFIKEFDSAMDAAIELGISAAGISMCINKNSKLKSIGGFIFKKSEEYYQWPNKNFIEEFGIDLSKIYSFREAIISRNVLLNLSIEKLEEYLLDFLKVIRILSPKFPYPDCDKSLRATLLSLQNYDVKSVYNSVSKEFNNMTSAEGNVYLKSIFKNYYGSNYNGGKSALEVWESDKDMLALIKYRVGVNKIRETFDFSLHQMVRGISSSQRALISFFKPVVAASIYYQFLKDKTDAKVIDCCAGFGGRLLGFASQYPNGTYIGIEPNKETYIYLNELKNNLQEYLPNFKCELYNCKLEDYQGDKSCDLTFTSIPYWDWEEYAGGYEGENKLDYINFADWIDKFINKGLLTYENLLINLPQQVYELSEELKSKTVEKYYLSNHKSHFSKEKGKKLELIIKLF